jgi:hypothetical protein
MGLCYRYIAVLCLQEYGQIVVLICPSTYISSIGCNPTLPLFGASSGGGPGVRNRSHIRFRHDSHRSQTQPARAGFGTQTNNPTHGQGKESIFGLIRTKFRPVDPHPPPTFFLFPGWNDVHCGFLKTEPLGGVCAKKRGCRDTPDTTEVYRYGVYQFEASFCSALGTSSCTSSWVVEPEFRETQPFSLVVSA